MEKNIFEEALKNYKNSLLKEQEEDKEIDDMIQDELLSDKKEVSEEETNENFVGNYEDEETENYITIEDLEKELTESDEEDLEGDLEDEASDEGDIDNTESEDSEEESDEELSFDLELDDESNEEDEDIDSTLKKVKDELNDIISMIDTEVTDGEEDLDTSKLDNISDTEESGLENDGEDSEEGIENLEDIDDETISEIDSLIDDEDLEEAHGVTHSARKNMPGRNHPGKEYMGKSEKDRLPIALKEENEKLKALLNKKEKTIKDAEVLMENYKNAFNKFKSQISELIVYNNNLSYANKLLTNESLVFTNEEKKTILKEFAGVKKLDESKETYKKLLERFERPIVDENSKKIDSMISGSGIENSSSKATLVENKAYVNNTYVSRIKDMMKKMDKKIQ